MYVGFSVQIITHRYTHTNGFCLTDPNNSFKALSDDPNYNSG